MDISVHHGVANRNARYLRNVITLICSSAVPATLSKLGLGIIATTAGTAVAVPVLTLSALYVCARSSSHVREGLRTIAHDLSTAEPDIPIEAYGFPPSSAEVNFSATHGGCAAIRRVQIEFAFQITKGLIQLPHFRARSMHRQFDIIFYQASPRRREQDPLLRVGYNTSAEWASDLTGEPSHDISNDLTTVAAFVDSDHYITPLNWLARHSVIIVLGFNPQTGSRNVPREYHFHWVGDTVYHSVAGQGIFEHPIWHYSTRNVVHRIGLTWYLLRQKHYRLRLGELRDHHATVFNVERTWSVHAQLYRYVSLAPVLPSLQRVNFTRAMNGIAISCYSDERGNRVSLHAAGRSVELDRGSFDNFVGSIVPAGRKGWFTSSVTDAKMLDPFRLQSTRIVENAEDAVVLHTMFQATDYPLPSVRNDWFGLMRWYKRLPTDTEFTQNSVTVITPKRRQIEQAPLLLEHKPDLPLVPKRPDVPRSAVDAPPPTMPIDGGVPHDKNLIGSEDDFLSGCVIHKQIDHSVCVQPRNEIALSEAIYARLDIPGSADFDDELPTNRQMTRIIEFAELIAEKVGIIAPWTTTMVEDHQDTMNKKLAMNQAAHDSIAPHKSSATGFAKTEALNVKFDDETARAAPQRLINQLAPTQKLTLSMYLLPLANALSTKTEFYAFGKSDMEIGRQVCRVSKTTVVETDFSKFDATVTACTRALELAIYTRVFVDTSQPLFFAQWLQQFNRLGSVALRSGTLVVHNGLSRLSGSPDTTIGNTLLNAFIAFCTLREAGMDVVDAYNNLGIYGGDDGLTAVPSRTDPDTFCALYSSIASDWHTKLEAEVANVPHFLSRAYPQAKFDDPRSILDLHRFFKKIHIVSHDNRFTPFERIIGKFMDANETDPHVPLISSFIRNFRRLVPGWVTPANMPRSWVAQRMLDARTDERVPTFDEDDLKGNCNFAPWAKYVQHFDAARDVDELLDWPSVDPIAKSIPSLNDLFYSAGQRFGKAYNDVLDTTKNTYAKWRLTKQLLALPLDNDASVDVKQVFDSLPDRVRAPFKCAGIASRLLHFVIAQHRSGTTTTTYGRTPIRCDLIDDTAPASLTAWHNLFITSMNNVPNFEYLDELFGNSVRKIQFKTNASSGIGKSCIAPRPSSVLKTKTNDASVSLSSATSKSALHAPAAPVKTSKGKGTDKSQHKGVTDKSPNNKQPRVERDANGKQRKAAPKAKYVKKVPGPTPSDVKPKRDQRR